MTPDEQQNNSDRHDSERHDAFLALFVEHQRSIYGYIFTMVPNHADAEDLLSETSMTLWRKFDEFELGTNFAAWACKISHYKVLNFIAAQSRTQVHLSEAVIEKLADTRLARGHSLSRLRAALLYCLELLPKPDYRLVQSCYGGTQSFKQVAKQIGRSASSVYKSLHRIRGSLMQCVERRLRNEEADV